MIDDCPATLRPVARFPLMQIRRNRIRLAPPCKMTHIVPIGSPGKLLFRTQSLQAGHTKKGAEYAAGRPSNGGRTRLYSGVFSKR
jgi:hypothetical protein